jgi:phenylacetic acid degradation operon negative regulatory protein
MRQYSYERRNNAVFLRGKGATDMGLYIQPDTIVFALFGQYVLPRKGYIWLGDLVRAMATLDLSEAAVRSQVLRMKKKGQLQSRRQGRRSFYWLTEKGMSKLNWGGFRFSVSPDYQWDGKWTVVVYSIPEQQREQRDALRNVLNWWGFGMLAPGVWISTRPLPPQLESKWQKLGIQQYLDVFRARYLGPSALSAMTSRTFPQLATLAEHYREYIARCKLVLSRFRAGLLGDEECFASRLRSIVEYVPIVFQDPALPAALLPPDWPRPMAQAQALELQRALAEPAERYFDTIYETTN